jgi:ATP:ADP antiporter, AAA family
LNKARRDKLLSRFVDLRPGEAGAAVLFFLYFFLITFPAYIIKPVKESLLQSALPPALFPLAPLLTAALIGFVVSGNAALLERFSRRRYVALTMGFFILSLLAFRFLFTLGWKGLPVVYWFWSDVFVSVTVSQFWIAVNDRYNPHQAKRLIGFFISGGLLGGIAGSLLSLRLAGLIRTENLLLVCPALLLLTLGVVDRIYKDRAPDRTEDSQPRYEARPKIGYGESFRLVRRNRYLLLLAGAVASATMLSTVIQQQFLTVTRAAFPVQDERTAFNAAFLAGLLVVSAFFNAFATGRILRRSGLQAALLIAPLLLLLGSAAVVAVPAALLLGWSTALKGADKGLENTLGQSVRELLYIPVPADIKYKAKTFIDLFVNKFAGGLGAVLILLILNGLRAGFRWLSLLAVLLALAWIGFVRAVGAEYVAMVKSGLHRKWEDGNRIVEDRVDIDLIRLVFDTVRSRDRSSLLYAMNLLELLEKERLTPELKEIIACREDEIRARTIGCLLDAGGETIYPEIGQKLTKDEAEAGLERLVSPEAARKVLGRFLEKAVEGEPLDSEITRMESAKILGRLAPTPATMRILRGLLRDPSVEVRTYALESARRLGRLELLPALLRHLDQPATRTLAAETLASLGPQAIAPLKKALRRGGRNPRIRAAVPGILSHIGTSAAAEALAGELGGSGPELDDAIIEGLYGLKVREPETAAPVGPVRAALYGQIRAAYRAVLEPERTPPDLGETGALLHHRLDSRVRKIFELLALLYPAEDVIRAYQNLLTGSRKAIDYTLEMLDNLLEREPKEFLLPLIEDLPAEVRIRRCRRLAKRLVRAAWVSPSGR